MTGPSPLAARSGLDPAPAEPLEVLVVGAGPVGLFAALHLARAGSRVMIVDKAPRAATRSYALALHAHTLDLLAEMGLSGEVVRRGYPVAGLALTPDGKVHVIAAVGGGPLVVLPQQVLEGLLESALRAEGVQVRWGHRLTGLAEEEDGVTARVEPAGGRPWTLAPAYVVGADGHQSAVRRALGLDFAAAGEPELYAVFELAGVDGTAAVEARVVFTEEGTSVLWPLGPGRVRWTFQIRGWEGFVEPRAKSRSFLEVGSDPFPYLVREKLDALLAERAPWFAEAGGDVLWSMAVPFERRLAERFGRGRVWLAGEAARLAGPIGVQSLNVGLREARDLARRLVRLVQPDDEAAPAGLLASYGRERLLEWRRLLHAPAVPRPGASPWAVRCAGRLPAALPATGPDLTRLLATLDLDLGPPGE